jgi:ketosteroid isomerase-like protein
LLLAHPSLLSGQQTEWEPVDVGLETANILKLDKEFAAAVLARNLEKAVGYLANNSWFLGPRGSYTQRGFVSTWAEFMDPESIVRWIRRPQDATVSLSGDIAVSTGAFEIYESPTEASPTRSSKYVSAWRRDEKGIWKLAANGPIVNWSPGLASLEVRESGSSKTVWMIGDPNAFADEGGTLRESAAGDLAYAIGEYFVALPNEDGTQSRGTGMSLTVWQKELGGNDWALLWESFPTPTKR